MILCSPLRKEIVLADSLEIPISEIPMGIKRILQNSRRINYLARRVLQDIESLGNITIPQHHLKYSVILFYYAIEELGKALKLKDALEESKQKNPQTKIKITWWRKHDKKINRTQKEYPFLKIPKYDGIVNGEVTTHILNEDSEIVKGFQERSEFFLIGYDMENEQWVNDLNTHIEESEVIKRIEKLDSILDDWQKEFKTTLSNL